MFNGLPSIRLTGPTAITAWLWLATMPAFAQSPQPDALDDVVIRALVVARDHAVLSAEIAARIEALPARPGDDFAKGDALVRLDCALYEAEKAIASADRDAATSQLASSSRLFDLRSIGALELAIAKSAVDRADAALRRAQVTAGRCLIRAPFAGRVVAWHAQPHEVVDPGVPVLEIVASHPLEVEAIVPSAWFPRLEIGAAVEIRLEETGRVYAAKLARLGAGVDPASRTLRVHALFDTADSGLRPGMSGVARFTLKASPP